MWNFTKDQEWKLHELLPPFSNIILNFYSKSWGSMIKVSSYLDILQDRTTTNSRLLSSGFEICFVGCWHFWPGGAASGAMQTSVLGCSSERRKNLKKKSHPGGAVEGVEACSWLYFDAKGTAALWQRCAEASFPCLGSEWNILLYPRDCSYDGSCSTWVPEHVASLPRVLGGHVAVLVRPLPPLLGWAHGQCFMWVSSALWRVKQIFLPRKW